MSRLDNCYNIADLREAARKRLPRGLFEFVDRGVEDEVALANNLDSFRRIKLWIRVLIDIDAVDLSSTLLGSEVAMPLAISPTGLAGLCWHEGELALAKAAAGAGIPYTLANGSITAMETLAKEAGGRLWFQIYMWRERELTYQVVNRARDAGFEALLVTVDTGFGGNREYNKRNGFGVPFEFTAKNIPDFVLNPFWVERVILRYMLKTGFPRHWNYPEGYQSILAKDGKGKGRTMRGENATWEDIDKLHALWPGKLLVKGILHPDDAQRALEHGADGIVISNHGGRSLDGAPAPLDILPAIVDAVGSRTTIILDSGVRRGSDIVKALALGADAVMAGRATLYGIAVGGETGASHALSLLRKEFRQTMGYAGCLKVDEINRDIIVSPQGSNDFR
ncbi:MAG TPA: alpha-hydroxy acid oxidase [Beijerinckiaceae bacterium]|jgi:isopentenyl diphosphate isomerase/L-lactate dehydrogenase-like FMN-dependent dehydrogenase|nr:alpha-hydroxy acid oxidase [Beijerinckiaceae bacterium]